MMRELSFYLNQPSKEPPSPDQGLRAWVTHTNRLPAVTGRGGLFGLGWLFFGATVGEEVDRWRVKGLGGVGFLDRARE